MMISSKEFMKLPPCDDCKGKGKYSLVALTEDDCEKYGVQLDEVVQVTCSKCRVAKRRREIFVDDETFEESLKYFEIDDYVIPSNLKKLHENETESSLTQLKILCDNFEKKVINSGGRFFVLVGPTKSGKSISAHILAREGSLLGYRTKITSILDMQVVLNEMQFNRLESDVFEFIETHVDVDILIVDHFQMLNEYFSKPDMRRGTLIKIFKDRAKQGRPTIVLSNVSLVSMFEGHSERGIPFDFPILMNKNYLKLELYGRYGKKEN